TRENVFRAGRGRLARVGYGSRLLDALFSLTLLLRGRVPGDTAAAAAITYRQMQAEDEKYVYYGRVVREAGWIALQYWFFYPFNNWRSGFHGVNDHEADWEMTMVCLYRRADGLIVPRWVAYASHDFSGDDLRRRWDDAGELDLAAQRGHPVIYAGAGSHASYFRPGEYLTEVEIPFLTPLIRITDRIREFWVQTLRQAGAEVQASSFNIFRIPFVDYARGDGMSLGPGGDHPWTPVPMDPVPEWASRYRGLWGLYARDPISGENAPAGPMYNRDGTVRSAWYDPLGWAGLHKVPTPAAELEILDRRCAEVRASQSRLQAETAALEATLQEMGVELAALEGNPHLAYQHQQLLARLKADAARRKAQRKELAQGEVLLQALEGQMQRLEAGQEDHPRAHIHRLAAPASDTDLRLSRLAEAWAAVSIGLLLAGVGLLYFFARHFLTLGVLGLAVSFVFIESVFRRQLPRLLYSLTLGLTVLSALVLIYQFFWKLALLGVLVAGLYLTWENIRELRG
ncbi:MAG: hypothetical protein HY784_07190, partial [Chloroflexi bacterium]|nr:hypothetical protein [Chloroflexota bacterium]